MRQSLYRFSPLTGGGWGGGLAVSYDVAADVSQSIASSDFCELLLSESDVDAASGVDAASAVDAASGRIAFAHVYIATHDSFSSKLNSNLRRAGDVCSFICRSFVRRS